MMNHHRLQRFNSIDHIYSNKNKLYIPVGKEVVTVTSLPDGHHCCSLAFDVGLTELFSPILHLLMLSLE